MDVIHRCLLASNIDQHKFFADGVLLEKDNIKRVLRSINRFIPDKILTLWLERNQPFLSHTKVLTPNEFLFLVCNTRDRAEAIAELPYGARTLARDPGNKTFFLDDTVKFRTAPERWLQRHADQVNDYDRLVYVGAKAPARTKAANQKTDKQTVASKIKEELDEFKQALRNPKLIGEIKQALAESQHQLNTARLSGRLAYEEKHLAEIKPAATQAWKLNPTTRPATARSPPLHRAPSEGALLARSLLNAQKFDMYLPPNLLFGGTRQPRPRSAVHWGSPPLSAKVRPFSAVSRGTALSRLSSVPTLPSPSFVLPPSRPVTAGSRTETAVRLRQMNTLVSTEPYHVLTLREAAILSVKEPVETPRQAASSARKVKRKEYWRY